MSACSHGPLTHDERKAAEAAFLGAPMNPNWTQRAQFVYREIWKAKHRQETVITPTIPVSKDANTHTHHRDASPLHAKAVQAWHVHYTDHEDDVLMLFPLHASMDFMLSVVQQLSQGRPFEMQPLKQGHFPISWPDQQTIAQLYAQDARTIDQQGVVRLRALPQTPPSSHAA